MAVSKAGERQEAVLTEGDTGSLPRSTVDMLNKECYDWNEDYFGFKNFSIKEAMISKNMFIKRWEREFAAYTIDGSNWDTHIGEYAKKCEKAVRNKQTKRCYFQSFLKEYKSKAINIKAVKIKIGSHTDFIGRVNKRIGKNAPSNHGLNGGPKFNEVVSFFRNKFAGKRIDNKLFTRMRNRHKKNLCVSCGQTRNHNWKTCANVDLKQ
ncbi:unnamed protein product [Hanseniaspora opuntiae]